MKKVFCYTVIFVNFFCLKLFAQNLNDTIFIKKSNEQNVYIEQNRKSIIYKDIADFEGFQLIKNISTAKWIELNLYKSKYYLYCPCDFCNNNLVSINNLKIIKKGCEKITYSVYSTKKFKKKIVYLFTTLQRKKGILEICFVNKKKGVAIFKQTINNKLVDIKLMLLTSKLLEYPVIVNDCKYNKLKEFEFDKIDFSNLKKF